MYKSADHKKEEYKRYLEKSGVTDALTKVMVNLYEEPDRPSNAIEYIRKYLGSNHHNPAADGGGSSDYDAIKKENEDLKKKIRELETQIGDLRIELSKGNEL